MVDAFAGGETGAGAPTAMRSDAPLLRPQPQTARDLGRLAARMGYKLT